MKPEENFNIKKMILTEKIRNDIVKELSRSNLETIVFLFGKHRNNTLTGTRLLIPTAEDYLARSSAHVKINPEFVAKNFPKLLCNEMKLVSVIHSHPRGMSHASEPDISITHKNVVKYYPQQLTGVYDHHNLSFYKHHEGVTEKVKTIIISDAMLERFDRQIRFLGIDSQLLISSHSVLLLGTGGGNTVIAKALACMGVRKLVLVDPDTWDETNRNRVFLEPRYIGWNKAASLAQMIEPCFPETITEVYPVKSQELPLEAVSDVDLIVVGTDTVTGRIEGNNLAYQLDVPAVFPAAGIVAETNQLKRIGGSVQVVVPGKTPCYQCVANITQEKIEREILTPEQKEHLTQRYLLGDLLVIPTAPSVASLNLIIAGIALEEIIWLITGMKPYTPFRVYDNGILKPQKVVRQIDCPACSEQVVDDSIDELVSSVKQLIGEVDGTESPH